MNKSTKIQPYDYNLLVLPDIYNIQGYSPIIISNEIIDEIIDLSSKKFYESYLDSKIAGHVLNFTISNINELLKFNFW